MSQLGYMFLAMGVGAFTAGIFHVMTHAFFKALLFLGSGSVIHAMHHEQDMMRMGALRKKLPITYLTMMAGTLAIAGIPFFSGFFSKDEILWKAFSSPLGGGVFWALGFLTAGLTSFYISLAPRIVSPWRTVCLCFLCYSYPVVPTHCVQGLLTYHMNDS